MNTTTRQLQSRCAAAALTVGAAASLLTANTSAQAAPPAQCSARTVELGYRLAHTYPGTTVVIHTPADTLFGDANRSLDVRIPGWQTSHGVAIGDRIAAGLRADHSVEYVLWRQTYRLGANVQLMENRGSASANHLDHLHVATLPGGGLTRCPSGVIRR